MTETKYVVSEANLAERWGPDGSAGGAGRARALPVQQHGLRVTRVHPRAALPRYASAGAAGLDLTAALDAPIVIGARQRAKVPTGLVIALPPGHEGQVRPRSGLAAKHGITVLNAPGTIDEDYRGELAVLLVNMSDEPFTIEPGERIAQLVVAPYTRTSVLEVDPAELGQTDRGTGGFGSTGR